MLNNWFYSHPTWEVLLVVCTTMVLVALGGLYVFHRQVNWEVREKDTTMVGLSYALAGGIYAIVISFVAVGVYESMDKATAIATTEANSLSGLAFDSAGLPAALGARVRGDVDAYVDIVTKKEWPSQQAYRMDDSNFEEGWLRLRHISLDLANFEPATMGETTVKLEMVRDIDDLFSARRARLLAAGEHLPDAVWEMMLFGLVMVLAYVCLFGPHSYRMHMAVTGLTAFTIGLVFVFIISVDYPFRGDLSVDDDAYLSVKSIAASAFGHGAEPATGGAHEQY